MKNRLGFILALIFSIALTGRTIAADRLFEDFKNPPSSARPDVYWWWNGNAVSEKEITRELDALKKAGIGGTLIFPMARTMGAAKTDTKELQWLSPEWVRMVKFAAESAKARGMYADLLVGGGWPFGGDFLKSGEQLQLVRLAKKELTGPAKFKGNIKDLMVLPLGAYNETTNGSKPKPVFIRLLPATITEVVPGIELLDKVKADGSLEFDVPAGKHVLYTGTWKEGFMIVNIPSPGNTGPVLNHFDADAAEHYLETFSKALRPIMGDKFGASLRSLHVDSFEFTGANWTNDFVQEFKKRRGYSLTPYLPLVLDWPGVQGAVPAADAVGRVRFDYWRTMGELFEERFLKVFEKWTHDSGGKMRVEAYGCPAMDPLDPKLIGDYPMGETWITIYEHNPRDETPIPVETGTTTDTICIWSVMSNKYVSSAAHLKGRHMVACETMTNDETAFRTNLEQFKQASDINFVSGINHPTWHGFNLNPPEAGFPGWFYCGEYIDPQNSWWPYFRLTNDYVARISSVLQGSTSYSEVAVIDTDSRHWVWEAMHQAGYSADYVSERILREASFEGGKIHYGPNAYQVLVINNAWAMDPEGAVALEKFAKAGGKIIFINQAPSRVSGLQTATQQDKAVKASIQSILKEYPTRVAIVPSPPNLPQIPIRACPEKAAAARWAAELLKKFEVTPGVAISTPSPLLYQIHQKLNGKDIFFFANLDPTTPATFDGHFNTGAATPWRWDPETAIRTVYPFQKAPNDLAITLKPRESLLLVFEPKLKGKPEPRIEAASEGAQELTAPWQVAFAPKEGAPFTRTLPGLIDFKNDTQLSTFAGQAVYRTTFTVKDKREFRLLTLGRVCEISDVTLNGKPLGVRWWGEHTYDLHKALKPGKNELEVKVTTVLSNYVRSMKNNDVARIWTQDRKRQVLSEGLIGPVRLCRAKE